MFIKGESSKYVKFYKGSIDFRSKDKVDQYQKDLVQTIQEKVRQCHRSMFVIDEVEKIPDGILDVISAAVQIGKTSEYDFRKVIFILLSNAGGTELNKEALSSYKQGIRREDMNLRRLTNLIATAAVNEGGLKNSQLVKNFDISYYVPFLPLERSHIVQCLEHFVVNTKQQVMSPELTELVLEDMTFRPEDEQLYSTSGCKGVEESAVIHIEGQLRRKRGRGPA
ncbi:torsin-like protein isoform X2 [Macrosteles quadrilineatus]|nr:torsin-like protein isoform X2 [Macrosteles quadrilineatus]XP_054272184.1 torsin-like protein isoform X2 [Macrosteles quadrilineatus]